MSSAGFLPGDSHIFAVRYRAVRVSLVAHLVKNPPAKQETLGQSLGREDPGGTPFQCACLENPVDRGAWWATGGVTESQTGLSD